MAVNPLANLAVTVNQMSGDALVIDPTSPAVLTTIPAEGIDPVDVAIDPGTDIAVFVNQGAPASVSIYSLGALRPLQILQASVAPDSQSASGVAAMSDRRQVRLSPGRRCWCARRSVFQHRIRPCRRR